MDWLNYHHLLYFWTVVQEGSVSAACKRLGLAQPTVSAQIRKLETAFGRDLFDRSGRKLVLTDFGQTVATYAEEIFTIGNELVTAAAHEPVDRPIRFVVGVADVVPKLVAHAVLEPALAMEKPEVRLAVQEGKTERLLTDLAVYDNDMVLSDAPMPDTVKVKAYNHLLGECGTGFFGTPKLARKYARKFPESLSSAPLLLPTPNTALRKSLDAWFDDLDVNGRVVAEFEDSALMKVFGKNGHGLFPAPMVTAEAVEKSYGVRLVGVAEDVIERFYAISLERRVTHPAVARVCETSRKDIFRES